MYNFQFPRKIPDLRDISFLVDTIHRTEFD